ncbi:MAG: DUF6165 family protein [Novosphingobium sp.]
MPVSWGELIDKITILRIKRERVGSDEARANVTRELALLERIAAGRMSDVGVVHWVRQLQTVNEALWEVEDAIREHEAAGDFGPSFIDLARSVYRNNDLRAAIKRKINQQLGSALIEEKSYRGAGAEASQPEQRQPRLAA